YQPVPDFFSDVARGGPVRFAIDLKSHEIVQRIELNYTQAPDFPAVDPRHVMHAYDEFWMLGISATGKIGRKFFDELIHANWSKNRVLDIYRCPVQHYLGGEPVFVAQPESGEGVVVCQEFDAQNKRSYFLCFDAQNVSGGPMARIALDQMISLGFHAAFKVDPPST